MYTYEYPRPALTVDCVIFGLDSNVLKVLLIQRLKAPFEGSWALPGGFVDMRETIDHAAQRELQEETGLENIYMEQLYTFGDVERDPRGRVVSVAYYALVKFEDYKKVRGATDAMDAAWFPISELPPLAFDHDKILALAYQRLKNKLRYQPIGFELLPEKFTFSQLQTMYETIWQKELDKRNFRKKILQLGFVMELEEYQTGHQHRAPRLYKFDKEGYLSREAKGADFEE
ncbi:MAG: NUDIX hydrolase [Thermoflexibacteraceae bacterium]|jgi:8-oxo-dGTP diphosphatase